MIYDIKDQEVCYNQIRCWNIYSP